MQTRLEHFNLTVSDIDHATEVLITVFSDFEIRGEGMLEFLHEGEILHRRWRHVGTAEHYFALQACIAGEGGFGEKTAGLNHIGVVVEDLDETLALFALMGYPAGTIDDSHPFRTLVQVELFDALVLELVTYKSVDVQEKNDYAL